MKCVFFNFFKNNFLQFEQSVGQNIKYALLFFKKFQKLSRTQNIKVLLRQISKVLILWEIFIVDVRDFFSSFKHAYFWVRTINVRIINLVQYFLFVPSRQPIVSYVLCYVPLGCIHIKLCKNKITRGSNYLFRVHLSLLHPKSGPISSTRADKSSFQELENGL